MADRSGQVAVVIGASGGLGIGLARRFAAEGARLVLADIEATELANAEAELTEDGHEVLAVRTDIVKAEEVDALAQAALTRFGQVDLVCNTVGVGVSGVTWELPDRDWRWQFDVNFWGVVNVVRSFTPILVAQQHGHLIATASTVALTSQAGNPAYLASKAAVLSVCESLQQDLVAMGSAVKVSVLIPGAIRSRMYDAERNRQPEYGERARSKDQASASRDYLEQFGADPDVLAEIIAARLDEGRFYVFGRPDDLKYAEARLDDIRQGFLSKPSFERVPGPGARATKS